MRKGLYWGAQGVAAVVVAVVAIGPTAAVVVVAIGPTAAMITVWPNSICAS